MIAYDLYYDKLSSGLKKVAKTNGLGEEHLEDLARDNGWTFDEFEDRMVALQNDMIAGDTDKLEYPLELDGENKVKAARMLANIHGRTDVLNHIQKMKAAGLIVG